jgi:acyl-ACP thioesterase
MPISDTFTSIFSKKWEINFTQCTPNGYLKYTDLCNLLQLTAAAHSEIGGISFSDMQQFNQAWVLSRIRVELKELPKWKDTITVKTWIKSLENTRSIRALEVYVNERKVAGAESFWAVFNTQSRRPEALALPYEHFELYPQHSATEKSFSKVNFDFDKEIVNKKIIALSDLDIVNHVNNVKYLEWCLDFVDEDYILNQKIDSIEMNFMKELSLKEEVSIYRKNTEKQITFGISKEDKNYFALELNLR